MKEKRVLVIGLDPALIDFSQPEFASTGMTLAKVRAGLKASEDELTRLGYSVEMCFTDFGAANYFLSLEAFAFLLKSRARSIQ
jgi:hypothetical protein